MEKEKPVPDRAQPGKKKMLVAGMGLLALLYLLNPTMGFLELIPDNLLGAGNLDETLAAAILLAALKYFGLDLTGFFGKKKP